MAEGYYPVYAEQNKVLSNRNINIFRLNTTGTAGTVVFENTTNENRFTGLLLITENTGYGAVYAVSYKLYAGQSAVTYVTKLAGTDHNVTIADNGNISVPLGSWSDVVLMRTITL